MIAQLTGTVVSRNEKSLVLDVHGVGYRVSAPASALAHAKLGEPLTLETHLAVRDDALELYGFARRDEREFFEQLIGISGIGPKTALHLLSVATLETLVKGIRTGDTSYLTKVSGVGKKIAEKIMLELKDRVADLEQDAGPTPREEVDAMEAMRALGFSPVEAREALARVPAGVTDLGARVKEALKHVGA